MKEIIISDKQKYFDEHYPFKDTPKLTDRKKCIHCDKIITVGEFKVLKTNEGMNIFAAQTLPNVTEL